MIPTLANSIFDQDCRKRLRDQAEYLLQREIAFIGNAEFRNQDHQEAIGRAIRLLDEVEHSPAPARTAATYFSQVCRTAPLSPGEESDCFVAMNFLKFKANHLRSTLDLQQLDLPTVARCQSMVEQFEAIRNHIVLANLRLVASIAKGFSTIGTPFDDVFSDGVEGLLHAVDKFDQSRGFRFSTYATLVLRRHLVRRLRSRKSHNSRFSTADFEELASIEQSDLPFSLESTTVEVSNLLLKLIRNLDPREQKIVIERFGFCSESGKKRTLSSIADDLGVSKERVRQLEQRALATLFELAAETKLNDLGE